MVSVQVLKEQEVLDAPLLLFDCQLPSGAVEHWCTHNVSVGGVAYQARVLQHNLFDIKASSADGFDGVSKTSVVLSNVDSHFSQIQRAVGWKGARLTVSFVFYSLQTGSATSDVQAVFLGLGNAPDEITESTIQLTFTNRLSLQRVVLPDVRIQRRCPWMFPSTADQRKDSVGGGTEGKYGSFYRCGYSPGETGGVGNLNAGTPYGSCDYSQAQCRERGMFDKDDSGASTKRFGGIDFVPSDIIVRSYGEKGSHVSNASENQARYNDFVPLLYGTAWYEPPIVFARNDGNLTRMEVLLGGGEIDEVLKVIVNDIDIPIGVTGTNMTGTGWFNVVSTGGRSGGFNLDFTDAQGNPLGDPYGSMAYASVVVPNRISDGKSLPRIKVLARGLKLAQYDSNGTLTGESYSNNPAWVLLDVFRRSGWKLQDINLSSFALCAEYCGEPVQATDVNGNPVQVPRFECNLALAQRRSAGDVVRGIRNASGLFVRVGPSGQLELKAEMTLALQQPTKPATSNSQETLAGGWPAYEFGDGSSGYSGILRRPNGEPAIRFWSRSNADTTNRLSVEFQDELNEYQQDSLSLVDVDDASLVGQEIGTTFTAIGLPNFSQAKRVMWTQLLKSVEGNEYVDLDTSVRGLGLLPGDIITISYLKEGLNRQPYRIVRVTPRLNFETVRITAQHHDDSWYQTDGDVSPGRRQRNSDIHVPAPLTGSILNADGSSQFAITESATEDTDSSMNVSLSVGFVAPSKPSAVLTGVPILGLSTQVDGTGGVLDGGKAFYYAITAVDGTGGESGVSFVARGMTAPGPNTNRITLGGISLPSNAVSYHVYRGASPTELLRIASDQPALNTTFVDDGKQATLLRPPDASFDHANFYWRMELVPETPATVFSASTIGNASLQMLANEYQGMAVRITAGTGSGQESSIASNTDTTLTVTPSFIVAPDASSRFVVAESSWRFGARALSSPVQFEVPNRAGSSVHVLGRSANAFDEESTFEISPLTRWRIGGAAGSNLDASVPGQPSFGLTTTGTGIVEVGAIGFQDLTNTRTISAGTVTIGYWNELNGPTGSQCGGDVGASDTVLTLSAAGPGVPGQWIQVEQEVMVISDVLPGGLQYSVVRGALNTSAVAHTSGTKVYHLDRRVCVLPFVKDFFGSPASGSYSFPVSLPDARIAAAQFFVTNLKGNSSIAQYSFTSTLDSGMRTLSGGQYSIQVEGYLAAQADAAPALSVEATHVPRDLFATVKSAPSTGPITLSVKVNGSQYALLTIPPGSTESPVASGFGLPPLPADGQLSLDILSVGNSANPGRDLTVTIRL